jgi:hypothetical protein
MLTIGLSVKFDVLCKWIFHSFKGVSEEMVLSLQTLREAGIEGESMDPINTTD